MIRTSIGPSRTFKKMCLQEFNLSSVMASSTTLTVWMDGFVYVSQDPWKEKSLAWHKSLSISVSTESTIVSKQPTTFANSQNASASMSRFAKIGGKAANNRSWERRISRGKNYLGGRRG